jgi:hypothetical protein
MNTCSKCGKMAGLHSSVLQGCMCQYSMQAPSRKREWVGLTDEEKEAIVDAHTNDDQGYDIWTNGIGVATDVEAKLKEKNT